MSSLDVRKVSGTGPLPEGYARKGGQNPPSTLPRPAPPPAFRPATGRTAPKKRRIGRERNREAHVRFTVAEHEVLKYLAERNSRTISGEILYAVRKHMEEQDAAADERTTAAG